MTKLNQTNKIYHYCSLKKAIEYIIPDKKLLLNSFGKTNDPRENKSFSFAGRNLKSKFWKQLHEVNSEVSKEIKKDCKLTCFSMDDFLFGYEYSRMWALYGDNHQGVCIEINKTKFLIANQDKIGTNFFKEIRYENLATEPTTSAIEVDHSEVNRLGLSNYIRNKFRPQNIDYLFFTKNKEWESENECRLIYFSDEKEKEYCDIKNCINRIILGVDFNINYLPAIENNCEDIQIDKLFYHNGHLYPQKI